MALIEFIERLRDDLRRGRFPSEAAVSQGIVLPILHELGWPVFDTAMVIPEFSVEGRRVDYALCHPARRPCVFVEVKRVGQSEGADRQLFEYAFHLGVPMAVLTDGQGWSFYLPGEQGTYPERRVYKLDLLERTLEEAAVRLERYLGYKAVAAGDALRSARSDYQNVARFREIQRNLPQAWTALLAKQDPNMLELLADEVEGLCGYRPDLDTCAQFLEKHVLHSWSAVAPTSPVLTPATRPPTTLSTSPRTRRATSGGAFYVKFKGSTYRVRTAREVLIKVFQVLAEADSGFLESFASRKHGKKRRYLARDKYELYPGRPDLADQYSVEVVPGWWLGTNYSRQNIQEIIVLALEVAGPQASAAMQFNMD